MIKFLSEFGVLIAFFVGYKYGGGIKGATIYMLVTSIIMTTLNYVIERKLHTFSLVSTGILLVTGGIALISGNAMFIKIKPTILYIVSGATMLISAIKKKPFLKYLFNSSISLDEKCWIILSYRFAIFFFVMAITNELVWRNVEEIVWVKFKVFIALPVMIVFVISQIPFILKNQNQK